MKAVIIAGGKGTRISTVACDIPKPMVKIKDKPVLEHGIECLRSQGFTDLIITVGHLGSIIMDYFGDGSKISLATGKAFGVNIKYYIEKESLGNAGALFRLKDQLTEDFLLLNGDIVFDVDLSRFVRYHQMKGGVATLYTHPNNHPYDSGLVVSDSTHAVIDWLTKEEERPKYYKNRVNAGIHIFSPDIFKNMDSVYEDIEKMEKSIKIDLDRHLLKPLANTGKMFCYDGSEYVKDMGTPDRFDAVSRDFVEGKVAAKNLQNKQKAIFLDRDGTINKYVGFLNDIDNFELLPNVVDAIKKINMLGYLAIVITNQPVIARGELTNIQLEEIHNKMETLLGNEGAYLDRIYFCPHHPDRGFKDEIIELKVDCLCRKPKPGMLNEAIEQFNIDIHKSWMIGDGEIDIKAGKAVGCKTAFISTHSELFGEDVEVRSLIEFVDKYID